MTDEQDTTPEAKLKLAIAEALEREMAAVEREPEPPAPSLPPEPDLVTVWRQIIGIRDDLTETIQLWEPKAAMLGEIPLQQLADLRKLLGELDQQIADGTRWDKQSRGHSMNQLKMLAATGERLESMRAARWVDLWLSTRDKNAGLTAANLLDLPDLEALEEIEREANKQKREHDGSGRRAEKVARIVKLALERRATWLTVVHPRAGYGL